jgi:hypothetical protein
MNLRCQYESLLAQAEAMFGIRNTSFVVDDIYHVADETIPNRLWYPSPGHVEIQLQKAAKGDPNRTLVQLSHETVHTLWPVGVDDIHVIEEGAATHFSMGVQGYLDQTYPDRFRASLTGVYSAYRSAEADVKALLSSNPAAIRDARRCRTFCNITAEDLMAVGCEPDAAQRLAAAFVMSGEATL